MFQRVIGVHWPKKAAAAITGAFIVILSPNDFQNTNMLAVSTDGMNWNFWNVPGDNPALWTIAGVPTERGGFVLMVGGSYQGGGGALGGTEQAVLLMSTDLGQSWFDNTPLIDGDVGSGTEIDGGGGSYGSRMLVATTWAQTSPYSQSPSINSVMINSGGGWEEVASAEDSSGGGYEFPAPPIPPDTICYNCAGGGFGEFPPSFYDPVGTSCPYLGPDGSRGFYSGTDTAIGPPGILTGGPPFMITVPGTEAGTTKDIAVDALNATGLSNQYMFFASNFPLP